MRLEEDGEERVMTEAGRQTDGWVDGWMDGQSDRQTDRQTNKQTDSHLEYSDSGVKLGLLCNSCQQRVLHKHWSIVIDILKVDSHHGDSVSLGRHCPTQVCWTAEPHSAYGTMSCNFVAL